ncbi:MAG: mannosyltransferase [Chitinophagales bacterium]|nr:mannosyltransferase [Chitinophagales bacterium]
MSEERHIHIVAFNVPYPPNYGGVIDVFFKIKALSHLGIKVHLHTFHYGRDKSSELEKLCASVHYYPRQKFYQAIYSSVPYIVGSRQSGDLLAQLSADDHPVLFEGLHTCLYLEHPALAHKLKAVRMHNIEWDYYKSLGKVEVNFFRKFYFFSESRKLKKYEEVLKGANLILAISPNDTTYLKGKFERVHLLPAFHANEQINIKEGGGEYALYHGNLGIQENNQAAIYLCSKVFKGLPQKLVIAGREPLESLTKLVKKLPNIELVANPDDATMQQLIANAHVHVLPTFQATGIKLKLINALFNGRFCLVNRKMVENTGLENLCIIADSAEEMQAEIGQLFNSSMTPAAIESRKRLLQSQFSNQANAQRLAGLIW